MSVTQYCNRDVITIAAEATALEAAKLMRKHRTGILVVVTEQDGKRAPLGLLAESTLVTEVMARGTTPDKPSAADLMFPIDECARADEPLWNVVERMRASDLRRLPVTDADGALVGLLAADDILELLAAGLLDIAMLTRESLGGKSRPSRGKRAAPKRTARKTSGRPAKQKAAQQPAEPAGERKPAKKQEAADETPAEQTPQTPS